MILNPMLPTAVPPDLLWRASFTEPWAFPTSQSSSASATLRAFSSRDFCLVQLLTESPRRMSQRSTSALVRGRGRRPGLEHQLDEFAFLGGFHTRAPNSVTVQGATPVGVFFDLRNDTDIADFRFHLTMDPEFSRLLKGEWFSEGISERLEQILAAADIDGVPCGGYLTLDTDDVEVWKVFPAGVGRLHEPERLGANRTSYFALVQLAERLGLPNPITPSVDVAREILAASITPDAYTQAARDVDDAFVVDA